MKTNETYKKLSKVAKENGFYLCPERVWNEMAKMMDYKDSEIKRLKLSRDNWKNKYHNCIHDKGEKDE